MKTNMIVNSGLHLDIQSVTSLERGNEHTLMNNGYLRFTSVLKDGFDTG